jgi:hypothetical protein
VTCMMAGIQVRLAAQVSLQASYTETSKQLDYAFLGADWVSALRITARWCHHMLLSCLQVPR